MASNLKYNHVIIKRLNEAYIQIDAEMAILAELAQYFSFYAPNAHFMPSYRNKMWDGKIYLFNTRYRCIYSGLIYDVIKFCRKNSYTFEIDSSLGNLINPITKEEVENFIESLNIHSGGKKITLHEYQIHGIYHALKYKKVFLLSPTSSGKSVVIYCILRWILEHEDINRFLIIVPTINLITQMFSDFEDYSSVNGWDVEENVHIIMQGQEKASNKPIYLSTYQSIYNQNKEYFHQFDAIIGDEGHKYTAKSIKNILENAVNCSYRIGTSGTVEDSKTHELVLQGLFGPYKRLTTTKELMVKEHVSQLVIKCVQVSYTENTGQYTKFDYANEIKFLINHDKRTRFICELALSQTRNTLILFNQRDHGKKIMQYLQKNNRKNKNLFYVDGNIDGNTREATRIAVNDDKTMNSVVVASYGTFSTGVNIKNLNVLIFASPTKAKIRVLQSIGRILRKGEDTNVILYDIADDLSHKDKKNFSLKHFLERIEYYVKEEFYFKIMKVKL